jgi:phosphoribosylaminoimidazole-succinocarboxamide synthase
VCVLQVFDYSKKLAESSIHKCKAILSRTVGETVLRQVNAGSSETRAPMSEVTGGVAGRAVTEFVSEERDAPVPMITPFSMLAGRV